MPETHAAMTRSEPAATPPTSASAPVPSTMVQKYGGTSVATAAKIQAAARRAVEARDAGARVAVVVSARGKTTDELIALAREIHPEPPAREMDMLVATGEQVSIALMAMAIDRLGHTAVSLTGGQMGMETDSVHGRARIRTITPARIEEGFAAGHIVILAGFQGTDQDGNITTLGRGGSDTTAVAIAAALGADVCEIHTDVDGIFTTDPRIVPDARKLAQISYDEMLELASVGAGVMHSRSIEFAKKYGVVIHVRNSGTSEPGTLIRPEDPTLEHVVVRGAALSKAEASVTVRHIPDRPGVVHAIFSAVAAAHVIVDMIVQNASAAGYTDISFTVGTADLPETLRIVGAVAERLEAAEVASATDVSKVSVVGLGMRTHSGVADRMFAALAAVGVNIRMITTSEIKISVLVDADAADEALRAVHAEFALAEPLPEHVDPVSHRPKPTAAAAGDEERLRGIARSLPAMEDILVSHVDADARQGRVTIAGIPDRPGVSAEVFRTVAAAGVAVDMIVQNVGHDGATRLTFSAPRADLPAARAAAEQALAKLGGGGVTTDDAMTILSVRGVGLRSHTGVAARLFSALADAAINIDLITTSELHVTVVVADADGPRAARVIAAAFGLDK